MGRFITRELPSVELIRATFNYDPSTGLLSWKYRPREEFATAQAYGRYVKLFHGKPITGGEVTAASKKHAVAVTWNGRGYQAHRIIWKLVYGELSADVEIDHKNCDKTDNRLSNLRLATSQQNSANRRYRKHGTEFKGVSFDREERRRDRPYSAHIRVNGRLRRIGRYRSPEDAHAAYCKAAEEAFGEFARAS